ncbi:MAG: N-acetyl-gamma-glutamyl-phosphate reductase [Ruminococcaceae bacterium]|nr:N-acetyl-gamma-glutamyl-phosphate reductase [Oscillospiraceae bacterium]
MIKVFIDGSAGTTGLKIHERLKSREDIELITLSEELRRDEQARADALNSSDVTFLCLPDEAAKQAVSMINNGNTALIDTSTAHRTSDGWTYGFAELSGQKQKIALSKRIANPGCHASGVISLIAPLREMGIIASDIKLTAVSLTGYSGGGKKMIADYESKNRKALLSAPRQYGLSQAHKHLPEISKICSLDNAPVFIPIVADYFSGMEVTVSLFKSEVKGNADVIKDIYKSYYKDGLVRYKENADENGFMSANAFSGRDDMEISVYGNDDRILLVSRFDNLGKGACGSAIQNMNLVTGAEMSKGLITE